MGLGDLYGRWHELGGDRESALSKPPPRSLFPEDDDASPEEAQMTDEQPFRTELIPEVPPQSHLDGEGRLGRHVEHDPASWGFPAERSSHLATVLHQRHAPIFDQGQIGSCTGNALAGLLATAPFQAHPGIAYDETLALALYERGTHLDSVPGAYPPDDTGSSGLAVAKAAKQRGLIAGYAHAFGMAHALAALVLRPIIIGIPWYDSFDSPDLTKGGLISVSPNAQVRGGHEVEVLGLMIENSTIRIANSWGAGWADQGYCTMGWSTFDRLLHEQGDVVTVH